MSNRGINILLPHDDGDGSNALAEFHVNMSQSYLDVIHHTFSGKSEGNMPPNLYMVLSIL